jgi:hypothetical protein
MTILALAACGGDIASKPRADATSASRATAKPYIQLTVAAAWSITDTDKATLTGTTVPGALLVATWSGQTLNVTADDQGSFSLNMTGIPVGETAVTLLVTESGYAPTRQSVTVTRIVSPGAFKASAASIPYNQLIKDPASMAGRVVTYRGRVFQYDSATTTSHLIVSVTDGGYGYWTDNVWIDLDPTIGQSVFNKTVIQFWGTVVGPYTYTTTSNGSLTIPEVKLQYLDVVAQP